MRITGFSLILFLSTCLFYSSCSPQKTKLSHICESGYFGDSVSCGFIQVPENHRSKAGKSINIAYAIISAKKKSNKPPVIFLNGGPGSKSLQQVSRWMENPFREEHDIILFDQRGTGHSSALPDVGPDLVDILASDLTEADETTLVEDALREVANAMSENGIDASNYNAFQSAQDVSSLMNHLGYEKYLMLGVSYGTKIGQLVAQINPAKIESLILYGPAPIFVNFYGTVIPYFENSINSIAGLRPELNAGFSAALEKASGKPFVIKSQGKMYYLNPRDITLVARYILYHPDGSRLLPSFVDALNANDTTRIREIGIGPLTTILGSNFTMYLSSMLYDEYLESSERTYGEAVKTSSTKHGLALMNSYMKSLPILHDGRASESEKSGGVIDLPTLILVNKFDPATPADNVSKVMNQIPNARLAEFERGGHIVWDSLSYAAVFRFWQRDS